MTTATNPATVDKCLSIGNGFHTDERDSIVSTLSKLDQHVANETADNVRFDLHEKEPGHRGRKVTLECHITGLPVLIATSEHDDIHSALTDVRDEMIRQIDDRKDKALPHHRS